MANDVTALMGKILARGHLILRGKTALPRIVNNDFARETAEKGSIINVKIPPTIAATDVTPSHTPQAAPDQTPETVPIPLDQWKEASFSLTDKEQQEIMARDGYLPMAAESAIAALASAINQDILGNYIYCPNIVGTPGTTPFVEATPATLPHQGSRAAALARSKLNQLLAPKDARRLVLDPDAAANALSLPAFQSLDALGSEALRTEGDIGRRFGFDIYEDQEVPTHVVGSLTGDPTVSAAAALKAKQVTIATDADDAVNLVAGDIVNFAGDSQNYAVTEDLTLGASATGVLNINPGLKVALTGSEAVTLAVTTDHAVNLAFQRYGLAFANRTLEDGLYGNANIMVMSDPLTGLSMRLEIERQHKQTKWSFDILWGSRLIREELCVRVAG